MGKPLSRPGCFRKSSCCLEKHGAGDGGLGGRGRGVEGGYGDGYIPQRSIYDSMCINQQIDNHHHHPGGSIRQDCGGEGSFSYSASGSLRVSRTTADMFDPQPRSLTPNPSFVRRLDERAIYDSLKLGGQDVDGDGCHSPGRFTRSVSPSVSSFSVPGVSSSSKKHHHHHHHHHGDSTKSRDGRHSWKVLTPPKHLESLELTTTEMMDRGGGYLNPGHYPPPGCQSSSLTSPLISPFSGSPLSSGYHTPVFFSPAKPRPSQTQSLRCSPPQVIQPRHYSQTQSLRLSPPHELRRSPYRSPLVQLSAHDLEQDMRDRGGWGRNEREREWEREREREMERGWAQREWERERERGRLERERARERERRETSTFGTFGYGRSVPMRSERDSVFLEPDQVLDTTPLLLPQPSPSPSPNAAPRMGTCAVGRNRGGSKVGPESLGGGIKFDNGSVGLVLIDSKSGCGSRIVTEFGAGNMSEAEIRAGMQEHHTIESRNKYDNGSRVSIKNEPEKRMGSQVKTRPGGRDLEGRVQSGIENVHLAINKEGHGGGTRSEEKSGRVVAQPEYITDTTLTNVTDTEINIGLADPIQIGRESNPRVTPEIESVIDAKASLRKVENRTGLEAGVVGKADNEVRLAAKSVVGTKIETEVKAAPTSEPEAVFEAAVSNETGTKSVTLRSLGIVSESQINNKIADETKTNIVTGDTTDTYQNQAEKKTLDLDIIESSHTKKGSRSQKTKSSKSSSRTRPGTATGLRPGVASPRLSKGLGDLESAGPADGIEFTWPRRILVRKRTVRQGGAIHNLPILPPLPSVLSALEKRHPHAHFFPRPAHFSENPLTSVMNVTSIIGRCSLKEPSHPEPGQGASFVGRASLKEQNLEHWRVYREQEEPRRARSKDKQEQQNMEKNESGERLDKEERKENERQEEKDKREHKVGKEKEKVPVIEGLLEEIKPEKSARLGKMLKGNEKENLKKEKGVEFKGEKVEDSGANGINIKAGIQQMQGQELEKVAAKLKTEEGEMEEEEGGTFEEGGMESWDTVLDMVTTLWDDGWEKEGAGGGDTDSLSGSLQRWPLLRPPIGFGGSHPPSSAASELSLTELERRARELDSDLEHLDLSQPQRETQDLYQTLLEPQMERADTYQTHPGPQRDKAGLVTGVGSRSQVSLEFSAVASPAKDSETVDWSTKSAGTSTVGTNSTKEDSSPDSNLTLESDSSGIFLSLSNQSQEEAGSDSDQPISGSDLGGSSTSLEKDGDDGGLKEWGREESADLQWCYPSLLNTCLHEDMDGDGEREEAGHEHMGKDEEKRKDGGRRVDKIGTVSIINAPHNHTDNDNTMTQSEELSTKKKVTLMGCESPLLLSPSKQQIKLFPGPNQKPIRSSGLDCGDLDPFVQSDSFVYLAVSGGPASQGEVTTVTEVPTYDTKQVSVQQNQDMKTHSIQSRTEQDARLTHLTPQKPEEGDFLCTDSFVYLAAPACLLLGPAGTTHYSGRDSDSESSGSGPVDLSLLGCGSVAGDSDWDSDLSDSDPSRSSKTSATGIKSCGMARPKQLPAELGWDLFGETTEPEVLSELFREQDRNNNSRAKKVTTSMSTAQAIPMATKPVTTPVKQMTTVEQSTTTKKVTWQFKPAQRSVCTGSRKDKEREMTSSSSVRFTELEREETHRPSSSSSSSSSD